VPECDVHHRILPVLLAAGLLAIPLREPQAATPAAQPASSAPAKMWPVSPELLVQGAGALVGIGAYSFFLAPQATAVGGVVSMLGDRITATAMATAGAISATYLYDLWEGVPIEYDYFWHRGGFVAGVAAGVAVFGVLGYPAGGGSTWLGWTINRTALIATGLYGAWTIDRWYSGRQ
jgi:hypothetical protein